jgi:hypothetical protein
MPTDPFKPPEADSPRRPRAPRPAGSPLRAVLTGVAVDIGGSALVGFLLAAIYALQLDAQGLSESDMREAMSHIPPDSAVAVAGTLLGALISVFAGYVCARIVRRDETRCGLAMAAIMAVYGLVIDGGGTVDDMALLFTACTVACNLLGIKFGAEHNRRADAEPLPPADAPRP